jgi:hypothetical protein
VDVQSCLQTEQNINVSITTIRNVLLRSGLVSRVKLRKPLLKNGHCQVRVAFARKHADWTVEHWKRVLWSDESHVELFALQERQHCWAMPGMPLDDNQVQPMVKHGSGSIMGWGCMTAHDVGHHCRIDGDLDAKLYRQILSNEMMQTLECYHLDKADVVFQYDNDSKHKAGVVGRWLEENTIQVLDWPAQIS